MRTSAHPRPSLGIAVTTFDRSDTVADMITKLDSFTSIDFELVVADDGSTDGTSDVLAAAKCQSIRGPNRGVAWNKNRGLYHLMNRTSVDIILLMDDDVVPLVYGWEQDWLQAAINFGHVNFAPAHARHHVLAGACRAADPGIMQIIGGQCLAFTREALLNIGYFDPRFGKYGHEHTDVSYRCLRAGFGGVHRDSGPEPSAYFFAIDSGLGLRDLPSCFDGSSVERNAALLSAVATDPIYRLPWRDDTEMASFLGEFPSLSSANCRGIVTAPGFDAELYRLRYPDVARSGQDPFAHYVVFGRREGRLPN